MAKRKSTQDHLQGGCSETRVNALLLYGERSAEEDMQGVTRLLIEVGT